MGDAADSMQRESPGSSLFWVKLAMTSAMQGLSVYLTHPRFRDLFRDGRRLPEPCFPETLNEYREAAPMDDDGKVDYSALRTWRA